MLLIPLFTLPLIAIIIAFVSGGIFLGIGVCLLTVSASLFGISVLPNVEHTTLFRIISSVLFLGAIYFIVETCRFGYWERHFYHPSDDTAERPPPKQLIAKIISLIKIP